MLTSDVDCIRVDGLRLYNFFGGAEAIKEAVVAANVTRFGVITPVKIFPMQHLDSLRAYRPIVPEHYGLT